MDIKADARLLGAQGLRTTCTRAGPGAQASDAFWRGSPRGRSPDHDASTTVGTTHQCLAPFERMPTLGKAILHHTGQELPAVSGAWKVRWGDGRPALKGGQGWGPEAGEGSKDRSLVRTSRCPPAPSPRPRLCPSEGHAEP